MPVMLFVMNVSYLQLKKWISVEFQVLTAVIMNSSIFWDIMPCSLVKDNQHFGGTYHIHLQGWRVSQARNQHGVGKMQSIGGTYCLHLQGWRLSQTRKQHEAGCMQTVGETYHLHLQGWREGRCRASEECQLTFTGLLGSISQKIELFI
jgi:hypothetical protein